MNNDQYVDDLGFPASDLDAAVQVVLTESIPEEAVERVTLRAKRLAGAATAAPSQARTPAQWRWRARRSVLGGLATAAVLLLMVTAAILMLDRRAGTAFAEVIAKVRAARSVHFRTMTQFGDGREIDGQMYLEGSRLRFEQFDGTLIQLADVDARQALFLDMRRKVAQSAEIDANMARDFVNPIDQLRRATADDAERIGEEILNGRRTQVYRLHKIELLGIVGDCQITVWADAESELPSKIIIRNTDPKAELEFRFDAFVWNQPLDEQLFTMNIPAGFQQGTVVIAPSRQQPTSPDAPASRSAPSFVRDVLHDRVPTHIVWNREGTRITAVMRDPESAPLLERRPKQLRQWDLSSGELRWTEEVAGAGSLAASSDGRSLATVIGREVQLRDADTGKVVRKWTTDEPLSPLAFSPDNKTLAAGITQWGQFGGRGGQPSGGVQIWDIARGGLVRSLSDDKPTTYVAYSTDGKYLATSSNDGPVKLWDVGTGDLARILPGRGRAAFSPDGEMIACIAPTAATNKKTGRVDLYRLSDAALVKSLASEAGATSSWLLCVTYSPDGHLVGASDWNGIVTVWDVPTGERRRTITEHKFGVLTVAFSPNGATLATGSEDKTLRLWKLKAE